VAALVLDASVLIGLLDSADAHHARAVEDVERADQAGHRLLAPASAYSEALVAFARADRVGQAREAIAAMGITITPLTAMIAERAAVLRARHTRLRLPDAIVLACAEELDGELLSYDEHHVQLAKPRLPADVKTKILSFRERTMGAHNVDLVLRDGRVVHNVTVAWGEEIIRVGQSNGIDFDPAEVVDARARG
jgi:predicted nucleic acid-binding protein